MNHIISFIKKKNIDLWFICIFAFLGYLACRSSNIPNFQVGSLFWMPGIFYICLMYYETERHA